MKEPALYQWESLNSGPKSAIFSESNTSKSAKPDPHGNRTVCRLSKRKTGFLTRLDDALNDSPRHGKPIGRHDREFRLSRARHQGQAIIYVKSSCYERASEVLPFRRSHQTLFGPFKLGSIGVLLNILKSFFGFI
jgi:hypothetical protein